MVTVFWISNFRRLIIVNHRSFLRFFVFLPFNQPKYIMQNIRFVLILFFSVLINYSCAQKYPPKIIPGAENSKAYIYLLKNRKVGVVGNPSSIAKNKEHLVDFLLANAIDIKKIFSPEHGFRGKADAGEKIADGKDAKTGIPIVSLYGKHKKPTVADLKDIDLMVFDLQDVGVRFYTYISTLHYVMEACAEQHIPLIVLDRPNPNCYFVDGAVLQPKYKSFVGMHPVPVVYGMTIGEYAQMINGEKWLKNGVQCRLKVIPIVGWNRNDNYKMPVKPSPNLPNSLAVTLYPSLCFFEGTVVSCGRGTNFPFQCFGHPKLPKGDFSFTPRSIAGASKHPKFKGVRCYGKDFRNIQETEFRNNKKLDLSFLITTYRQLKNKTPFFNSFFVKLAGNNQLQKQIEAGLTEKEIRKSWQKGLDDFKIIREKYLIYK